MNFFKFLFGQKNKKDTALSASKNTGTSASKAQQSFVEADNLGTRCETQERGETYFTTLFHKGPEPLLFYFFDSKEKATEAVSNLSCIQVAIDTGNLIATEIVTFGVFPGTDQHRNAVWGALLAGKALNQNLWTEAQQCFINHGGKMRREEPPEKFQQQPKTPSNQKKSSPPEVTFVRTIDLSQQGGIGSKKIYSAPDKNTAQAFLKKQNTSRPFFYIEVETPEGWVGKDRDGMYEF